ncbi:MAG: hypothetical protein ACREFM_10370 [Hypericibacter sp.]
MARRIYEPAMVLFAAVVTGGGTLVRQWHGAWWGMVPGGTGAVGGAIRGRDQ